jgi:hypothetical protein
VRAVDASRPAARLRSTLPRTLDSIWERHVAAGSPCTPEEAIDFFDAAHDDRGWLVAKLRERPALTEEQARVFAPIVAAQSTPWPIYSVLQKLADAADHLLRGHGCDRHGYEEVEAARDAAREILAATGIESGRFTARFAVDDHQRREVACKAQGRPVVQCVV